LKTEPESDALREALIPWGSFASASLLRTETARALHLSGNGHLLGDARRLMGTVHLIKMDEPLLDRAGDLPPPGMRSLDAVHLAAALSLGPALGVVVTYDNRLRDAAVAQGLSTDAPR
jgi:predicted nucleic acid-binding protein